MEQWKDVVGFDGYKVSDAGRVIGRYGKYIGVDNGQGYIVVKLYRNGKTYCRKVHTLVLEAFVGPKPAGMEVRHLDGVRSNNDLSNLRWGNRYEQVGDKRKHGTIPHGERSNRTTLAKADVLKIRSLNASHSYQEIADMFGISKSSVQGICNRRRWKHI